MTNETFHFIGIGGIGMSAIARILLQRGDVVRGSDLVKSSVTEALSKEGAQIWTGHSRENIIDGTVIYNSAIQERNEEYTQAKNLGLKILHRSEILDQLMCLQRPLLVTGTHGKTSTTALLASVFIEAELDPSFVVGGIVQSVQVNGRKGNGSYFIAEADESDGSFLKTPSFGAIITNCEEDHLDFWGSMEKLTEGFKTFANQVLHPEHLFWCKDDPQLVALNLPGFSYGFDPSADLVLSNYHSTEEGVSYDFTFEGNLYSKVELSSLGRHQALNSAAVFGLSLSLKVEQATVRKAFKKFQGIQRRLEKKGESHGVICFDDYGHHPTEIEVTLKALKEKVLEKRLVVLFQPHRFSRLKGLWNEFLSCFSEADLLIITDLYSAGEKEIEGITGEHLASEIGKNVLFIRESKVIEEVASILKPLDILLTLGAGSVTHMGPPILEQYEKKASRHTVGVICGGVSPEHEVSLLSAEAIVQALDPLFYSVRRFYIPKDGVWMDTETLRVLMECDVVIPVLHGPQGEDGMMQGFLETLQIPYVGCSYGSAAVCMHKGWTKQIVKEQGIPVVPYVQIGRSSYRETPELYVEKVCSQLTFPVWVKAVHLGSSIGVTRAESVQELQSAIEYAFAVDDELIVEKEIEGEQIEFAALGNEVVYVGEPCRIVTDGEFYDYAKKYGSAPSPVEVPACISSSAREEGIELAKRVYRALGCQGIARVDFFLDRQGEYWLNEVNPFPGFTVNSGYPKMWEATGLSMTELLNKMVMFALAKSRSSRKQRVTA